MGRFDVNKISWAYKKNSYKLCHSDISIRVIKNAGKDDAAINFIFRNDVWKFFGERVDFALYENCVLLKASSEGVKIGSASPKCTNKYAKLWINRPELEYIRDNFVGDFDLQYDKEADVYYIEKTK